MKILYIILFLSLSTLSFGQEELKSMVTFDFLTGSTSQSPRLNVGFIHKVDDQLWAGIDIGYGNKKLIDYGYIREEYQLFEVRPEIYYDLRPNKLKHMLSIEGFYIHHTDTFHDSSFQEKNHQIYKYRKANYKRIKIGANFNYNLMYYFGKRWGLMQKLGLGLRHRQVDYFNIKGLMLDNSEHDAISLFSTSNDYREKKGSYFGLNFNFALRFFYKF